MKILLLIFIALFACNEERDVQPQIIKIDNGLYEVRYRKDASLKVIAKALCDEMAFNAAPMGRRHDVVTGNSILTGTVRCLDRKRHD